MTPQITQNLSDILAGLSLYKLWSNAAWLEVKQKYRRSILGSFWITLSLSIMIGGLGFVFGTLFNQDPAKYIPYVGFSLVAWNLITSLLNDGSTVFVESKNLLLQYNRPTSIHIYRFMLKVVITFLHNSLVIIALIILFSVPVTFSTLTIFLSILIYIVAGFSIIVILGFLSLKFRDLPFITLSATQVSFFITPVMWRAEDLGVHSWVFLFNPFYHFLEIFRQPLLGQLPEMINYTVSIAFTSLIFMVAIYIWAIWRHRLYYFL